MSPAESAPTLKRRLFFKRSQRLWPALNCSALPVRSWHFFNRTGQFKNPSALDEMGFCAMRTKSSNFATAPALQGRDLLLERKSALGQVAFEPMKHKPSEYQLADQHP